MKKGISVIICCYNSAARLADTLKALSGQQFSAPVAWEVVVVDNASTDATPMIAKTIWQNLGNHTPLRVVAEPAPGLTFARKKGIQYSQYCYVLFCDDDNWLDPDYIYTAYEIMEKNSHVVALGGKGRPVFQTAQPEWFEKFQEAFAVGSQAITCENGTQLSLYGAGLVLRKSSYEYLHRSGYKEFLSDRTGAALSSSGDTELTNALTIAGFTLMAVDELGFQHFLPANRLEKQYLEKLFTAFGSDGPIRNIYYSYQTNRKPYLLLRLWWFHLLFAIVRMVKYVAYPPKKEARRLYWKWSIAYIKSLIKIRSFYDKIYYRLDHLRKISQSTYPDRSSAGNAAAKTNPALS